MGPGGEPAQAGRGWQVQRRDRPAGDGPPAGGPEVVLDNIRSAFNVGAIFRTCEAAGVAHLYLCGISAHPPNPRVLKTALGAAELVPWTHELSTVALVDRLRAQGRTIVAVELTQRSSPYTSVAYPRQAVFVFGHEVAGVALPVLDRADHVVQIPMRGRKNSLNVATSVGIVLFEWVRQRGRAEGPATPAC
jgi:23S rRNA (guanosine2251-2'-O)-methyltransferase